MMDFSGKLLAWYKINKRSLPWRETSDPYLIWLSEIILQQTRINQGMSYYLNFCRRYPAIFDLAEASEQEVLKLWQGLGYYSRARNLHATAKEIVRKYHGIFPQEAPELKKLKGIGDYTAAAIASIAFNKPEPVIDGNVKRVLSRVFGIEEAFDNAAGKRKFKELAKTLISRTSPGDYNQALMDFGSTFCVPVNPGCTHCIFKDSCVALCAGKVAGLPVSMKKTEIKNRYFNYLVFITRDNGEKFVYLKKRNDNDIWKKLYDFPMIESSKSISREEVLSNQYFKKITNGLSFDLWKESKVFKHQLTHRNIFAKFRIFEIEGTSDLLDEQTLRVRIVDMHEFPVPRLLEKFIQKEIL